MMQKKRIVVWGTGNVGRPAIRAVQSHSNLQLAGVLVSNPAKVGRDAGEIAGIPPIGVMASDDAAALLATGVDAVVYTATADTRPEDAIADLLMCLEAGANVVSTSFYAFLHPKTASPELLTMVNQACRQGDSSLFVSGIDPGWVMDVLPVFLSAMVADITQVRVQEIFNYSLYDQPEVVRNVIGFGGNMDELPLMLHDFSLLYVWEPMLRLMAEGMGQGIESVATEVERRPLEQTVEIPGMGRFEAGTQGAFRFEVRGICGGQPVFVIEHITRIVESCAPDWPYPPEGQGCHRVMLYGSPNLHVTVHAEDPIEAGPAAGGNTLAANRIVNAIEAVCDAASGIVSPLDLPRISGQSQLHRA
jgi:hypothetical protein